MVGIAIGLLLLMGLTSMFVTSSKTYTETERASRQIENGRYALDLLGEEIRHAGFYGEASSFGTPTTGAPPDPCSTTLATLQAALPIAIQGVDFIPGTADPSGKLPSCVPDHVAGTDVLVIRRVRTNAIPAASAVANGVYSQIGACANDSNSFQLVSTGFTYTTSDCASASPIRQFITSIFFISPCSIGTGTGGACQVADRALPTLKRMELRPSGWTVVPLVEGIENMQLEYGVDTDSPPDGSANSFTASPAATGTAWAQTVVIRVHLLARNVDETGGFVDSKTYRLGVNADGTDNNVTPGGAFKRHQFTGLVRVVNVSQRWEPIFGGS